MRKSIENIQNETKRLTDIGDINLLSYYTLLNVNEDDINNLMVQIGEIDGFEPLYYEEYIPIISNSIIFFPVLTPPPSDSKLF